VSEWQPIETAPRDATVIIIRAGDWVQAAYWNLAPSAGGEPDKDFPWTTLDPQNGLNGRRDGGEFGPTHWCHLPKFTVSP